MRGLVGRLVSPPPAGLDVSARFDRKMLENGLRFKLRAGPDLKRSLLSLSFCDLVVEGTLLGVGLGLFLLGEGRLFEIGWRVILLARAALSSLDC